MTACPLGVLLAGLVDPNACADLAVSGLTLDSRQVRAGDAFVALRGLTHHGIAFAAAAATQGARVVLAEAPAPADAEDPGVPVLWIENLHNHVGEIAARFFDRPAQSLHVIGITGTNGKTSCVQLLAQALTALGHRAATIGTLGTGLHGQLHHGERTTPDAISVQACLAEFRDAGATHVAMEVSSHALAQDRVASVDFDIAALTNLTRDHLDYHGSMQAYGAAKAKLFAWPGLRTAIINIDDPFGRELLAQLLPDVHKLSLSGADASAGDREIAGQPIDVSASAIRTSTDGLSFELTTPWGSRPLKSALLGRFNVANVLTVAACLGALGESFEGIVAAVGSLQPVAGRMSRLGGGPGQPLVVVDYAHTPDALEQALNALRPHCAGRLICVFGCGGERDAGKRPLMGAIAERLADVTIITDDNPRGENGDRIVADIVGGLEHPHDAAIERERARAIALALATAGAIDVVLIAGKGHETYQEVADGKRAFDDMAVAQTALDRLGAAAAVTAEPHA